MVKTFSEGACIAVFDKAILNASYSTRHVCLLDVKPTAISPK